MENDENLDDIGSMTWERLNSQMDSKQQRKYQQLSSLSKFQLSRISPILKSPKRVVVQLRPKG